MDYEEFSTDEKTIDVVIKCLLIIGEAARSNKILESVDFRSVKKSVAEVRWLLPPFLR